MSELTKDQLKEIEKQAIAEVQQENYRRQIEEMKIKIRNKKTFWKRVFPYKITITKG